VEYNVQYHLQHNAQYQIPYNVQYHIPYNVEYNVQYHIPYNVHYTQDVRNIKFQSYFCVDNIMRWSWIVQFGERLSNSVLVMLERIVKRV